MPVLLDKLMLRAMSLWADGAAESIELHIYFCSLLAVLFLCSVVISFFSVSILYLQGSLVKVLEFKVPFVHFLGSWGSSLQNVIESRSTIATRLLSKRRSLIMI